MGSLTDNVHDSNNKLDTTAGIPGKDSQIFIVRIRTVRREIQNAPLIWRGEIEHLNTGRKAFLKALAEIILFIRPILREIGLETMGTRTDIGSLLNRLQTSLAGIFHIRKRNIIRGEKSTRLRSNKK